MSLWERAPREVYRVYGEEQYLEGHEGAPEGEGATEGPAAGERHGVEGGHGAGGGHGAEEVHGAEEGRSAAEGDGALWESARTLAPDARSWTTFADDVIAESTGNDGSQQIRSSGRYAGRLVGFGLLVGVSLATLAVLLLNISQRRQATPGPPAHRPLVQPGRQAERIAGANHDSAIVHSANTGTAQLRRIAAPSAAAGKRAVGPALEGRVPDRLRSNSRRARPWAAQSTGEEPLAGAVEPPPSAPVESPSQVEFGFEW
ncbi:MAG TPA: hypothetical protein VNU24_03345 [Solirubrobacteraceae bacterium]|nr:hypothetical protein [Solirubrobacteraceae bacterium]